MAPPGSANTSTSAISANLSSAINSSFGGLDLMQAELASRAKGVFGSGWSWLCYSRNASTGSSSTTAQGLGPQPLIITTTANQDNPLMEPQLVGAGAGRRCTPILGIDVWEHGYYLQYKNERAQYVDAWWGVVNWAQVSSNFDHAVSGRTDMLVVQ
jgi:Fe-Mn family superoxide dismutase